MTTNGSAPGSRAKSGQILSEAARRMLPVLAGRVLSAVADRAVDKVEGLADRLDRTHDDDSSRNGSTPDSSGGGGGGGGGTVGFLLEQARLFLAFVVRLAAQALAMVRRVTEMLRERRAPEGIDDAPEPEEISDPEDLEDEYEDEYEDDEDDDEVEERAPARA